MPFNPFSALTSKIFGALLTASVLCLPLAYCKGRSDGKAVIRAAVAEASQEALKKASEAGIKADTTKAVRDATFQQSQETIKEAVDEAIANDSDPISSYFDGLRSSQD